MVRRTGWIAALWLFGCGGDAGTDPAETDGGSSSSAGPTSGSSGPMGGTSTGSADESSTGIAESGSGSESGGGVDPLSGARLYNVTMDLLDPRWTTLPEQVSTVQLPPAYTLQATVPEGIASVRLSLDDGPEVLDEAAPFRLSEDDAGEAAASTIDVGAHVLHVEAFAADGSSQYAEDIPFEVTTDGTLAEPGAHTIHSMWQTDDGTFVTRDAAGNFVDADGTVVFTADRVSTSPDSGDGQVQILIDGSDTSIVFAFIVALPDGFDPAVPYPLVVFLHHGWAAYRGTDNDGLPLDAPLFAGPRSIIADSAEHARFPSIVLVPQMRRVESIDGVTNEWASFSSITDNVSNSGPDPSVNVVPVLDVVDLLETGGLPVGGQSPLVDGHRIYVAGHSMGGLGSWDLLERLPDRWAAGVPMAGYSDHAKAMDIVDTPIWAFHHEIDCYNASSGTQAMADLVAQAGGTRLRYTLMNFDTGGACDQAHFQTPNHAWNEEPELFEWLFAQVNDRL